MEDRRWEDLTTDCLVNIFRRLDLESRLLDIPLVCKTWYQTVQNQLCWRKLDFSAFSSRLPGSYRPVRNSKRIKLMKFVVNLSQRCATSLVLWNICTEEELIYLSEECPALKTLVLPKYISLDYLHNITSFIVKWKNLEFLSLESSYYCTVELIMHISLYLPNFIGLCVISGHTSDEIASTIVSLLPKLKYLTINQATLQKKNLLLILKGCKELVFLDVRDCIGFDEDDEEILKLSSVIKIFQCKGSTSEDPHDDYSSDCYMCSCDGSDSD